jgi:lipid-binding SYLF domain-containing protein
LLGILNGRKYEQKVFDFRGKARQYLFFNQLFSRSSEEEIKMRNELAITSTERTKQNASIGGLRWQALKVFLVLALAMGLGLSGTVQGKKEPSKKEKQSEVRSMAKETLGQLYKLKPEARKAVQNAAGYAAFSNFGLKIFVAGSGKGEGIAVNNKTKKATFMKMFEIQAGLGLGVKKFRLVWVFENQKDFNDFINSGWEFGGQATAAAKKDDEGGALAGAVAVSPGVWLYQLTGDGLALELTVKGTKYYKDDELN